MRLPPVLPQLHEPPVSLQRALYKASTGSYKAPEFLQLTVRELVARIGGYPLHVAFWEEDDSLGWRALAEALPARPTPAQLSSILDSARQHGLIDGSISLDAKLPESALSAPFSETSLERLLGVHELNASHMLIGGLRYLLDHWDGTQLTALCSTQMWLTSYHRVEVAACLLFCSLLVPPLSNLNAMSRSLEATLRSAEDEGDVHPYDVEVLVQTMEALNTPVPVIDSWLKRHLEIALLDGREAASSILQRVLLTR